MSDLYETYIRTRKGDTYHPNDIREGIEQFLSEEGYRIAFNIDGVVIVLRKNHVVDEEMKFLDEQLGQTSLECAVTIKGFKDSHTSQRER